MDDIKEVPEAIKSVSEAPTRKIPDRRFLEMRRFLYQMIEQYEETFKIALASRYRAKLKKNDKLALCSKEDLENAREWISDLQEGVHDIIDLERRLHVWESKIVDIENMAKELSDFSKP